jgi:predicted nucleic acid-binding protein
LEQDRICLSTQILQELYVTLTRKAGIPVETALSVLDDLSQWLVFSVDYRAIRDAVIIARDSCLSFWDALLVSAANRLGAAVLLTEDLNHGQTIAGVEVRNPFINS